MTSATDLKGLDAFGLSLRRIAVAYGVVASLFVLRAAAALMWRATDNPTNDTH